MCYPVVQVLPLVIPAWTPISIFSLVCYHRKVMSDDIGVKMHVDNKLMRRILLTFAFVTQILEVHSEYHFISMYLTFKYRTVNQIFNQIFLFCKLPVVFVGSHPYCRAVYGVSLCCCIFYCIQSYDINYPIAHSSLGGFNSKTSFCKYKDNHYCKDKENLVTMLSLWRKHNIWKGCFISKHILIYLVWGDFLELVREIIQWIIVFHYYLC